MNETYESNSLRHKPWKKALCVLLSITIAFGALIALTGSTEKVQNWVEMHSMLSDYANDIVDTKGAIAIDKESMLSDRALINLENSDGSNTVYLFSEPISYTDENGNLKTKDISVEKQKNKELKAKGYEYANGQNDYRINFSSDSTKGLYIELGDSSYTIIPQSEKSVIGDESISEILSEKFEDFEYKNIYGEGTNLKFYPQLNGVKDEIVLNSNINQNIFSFKLITNNCTAALNDDGTVSLVGNDSKESVQTFSAPFAYDSEYVDGDINEHYTDCEYTLEKLDDNTYLMSVNVDKSWLESDSTVYPVTIDPTTANLSYRFDTSIYSAKASNNYGSEQTCCFGRASDYGYGRVLYHFIMPDDIKKGATINSAYSWLRETTGRTASTTVKPYVITDSWSETTVTYSNKPNYATDISLASRNINSTSTDNPNSSYWYKFNIAPAVKAWADGKYVNRGLMFISSEETSGTYNWRAFASRENSTSSYRPYFVINYTNDTTAPTVTSVTGNPTAWTKDNVTLTVNGAKDNTGGAGLHATPYSFSTVKDSYSWQAGNTKTFSANATVYVYVRDAVGNIKLASTQTISKIDKTKPSKPTVSGNASDWTTQPITLTASSTDSASGIKDYSFSTVKGSYSWQTGKTKSFSQNTTVYVYARDNANNISDATEVVISKYTVDPAYLIDPVFYEENNLVGIYNPRAGKENMQYKIGDSGEWITYTVPFAIPLNQTVKVYAKFASSQNAAISKTFSADANLIGSYTESNTDFSFAYKNVSFDFTRTYNSIDKKWFFATDSSVTTVNDYVISAVLPDSTKLSFVKTADNTYTNEINGYTLTKSDNGFIIQLDGIYYTYGADGLLSKISNKYDDTITLARTASSVTVTDGTGRAYVLTLNSNGNITSVTDPANNVIAYAYSGNNLIKVTDQAGVTVGQYRYTNGVLTKSMDKTINYGTDGRVTSFVYDSGAYLNYTYDDESKTVSTESSVETTSSQTYNDALMLVSSTDENGNTTQYSYDSHYRTSTETKDGTTVTYTYDSKGNVLSEVSSDEDAENTYYTYDANGNIIVTQTGDKYTYSVYNSNDELIVSATLKENYTGTIPEQYSEELTCFDTVKYTYENGILIKTVDSKAKETVTNVYDIYGNSVKVSSATQKEDGTLTLRTVDSTYDIMGNLLTTVSGEDTSSYIYDKAGRTLLSNENGECTRTVYDTLGRTVQEISPEDYDSAKDGLPENNTYSDSNAGHRYVYAANGTLTSETNRLGKTTTYYYNDIGSKVREEFDIYKFYYLNHGELYQVKVANTVTVAYNYDNEFKLVSEAYANDEVIRYKYNENGDLTAQYHNSNAKPYVTYTYNDNGELTEKVNTDTGLKYVYGENNSVSVYKISDNSLISSYTATETEADEANNITAKTDISETHFGLSYSSVIRDKSIDYTFSNNTAQYSYQTEGTDENEKMTSDAVKYNGATALTSEYTYDDNGNITSKLYALKQEGIDNNIAIINEYDEKNRITAIGYNEYFMYYQYDSDGQLIRVDNRYTDNSTSVYSYDSRGNITQKKSYLFTRNEDINTALTETKNFTYANSGWKDQLIAVNGVELTYDEIGNVLTYGNRSFTWNSGRNLQSISDGTNNYSYTYDENGIRTSKTVNGVTTYYNTKNGVILSQSDGTNTMYFQYDTSGTPLGFILNGTQYFYITNQMGDVVAITDSNGDVIGEYVYDEWGYILSENTMDPDTDPELVKAVEMNPLRYRGYCYDRETGYYYLQSRYYDPSICRFINADIPEIASISKGISVGENLFAYCNNDAVNKADALGTISYYIDSYSRTWVTKFLRKYVSYAYDYSKTIWEFKRIPGVKITLQSTASYTVGGLGLFKINNRGGLSISFGGISVSAMSASATMSTTFTYRGSSIGAFIGISGKYLNLGYYAYSTVSNMNSKVSIGFKLTVSVHIAYIFAFATATYAVKCLCPALAPVTAMIKSLYRTPAGIYSQALILSGAIYSFA